MAWGRVTSNVSHIVLAASFAIGGAVSAALADAQPAYDRRIEEAAIRMLQPKLGDIRGSLELAPEDHLFPPLDRRMAEQARPPSPLAPTLRGRIDGSIIRY